MATIVLAPDGFGGTLRARQAAAAIAEGWRRHRPDDQLRLVPMSDGGEGLLDVLTGPEDAIHTATVAGPLGRPVEAAFALRPDGTAIIESARACGLTLVASHERSPLSTTTYGVGELLDAAREAGARRILVGLGGSATVDGGAGALSGLGFRCLIADGSGLKIGGGELHTVAAVTRGWAARWSDVRVELLADVQIPLLEAARLFGPQKGATAADVKLLTAGLQTWAGVAERDLLDGRAARDEPGTGAAGGLGFGLLAGIDARIVGGSARVAELVGLDAALAAADLVITGEGRIDATTGTGKVVDHITDLAARRRIPVAAVVGQIGPDAPRLADVEAASPDGPGDDPYGDLVAGAARLAARIGV